MEKIEINNNSMYSIPTKFKVDQEIEIQHHEYFSIPEKATIVKVFAYTKGLLVCPHYDVLTSAGILPGLNEYTISRLIHNADYINRMKQLKTIYGG